MLWNLRISDEASLHTLMWPVFQGYYDNPKVCALYVMKGTLEGESHAHLIASLPLWAGCNLPPPPHHPRPFCRWQTCPNFSPTPAWRTLRRRRKRRTTAKEARRAGKRSCRRAPSPGSSRARGHRTRTPPTTAALCSPSWWRSGFSSRRSSASVGCEAPTGPNRAGPDYEGGVRGEGTGGAGGRWKTETSSEGRRDVWRDSQHEVQRRRSRWRRRRWLGPSTAKRSSRTCRRRSQICRCHRVPAAADGLLTGRLYAFTLQLVGFRSLLRRRPAHFSRQLLDDSHAARCECRTCNSCFFFFFMTLCRETLRSGRSAFSCLLICHVCLLFHQRMSFCFPDRLFNGCVALSWRPAARGRLFYKH